jgi:hypothetical protein
MTTNTGGLAFPHEYKYGEGTAQRCDGMTLRDYFAAKAMQGIYACPDHVTEPDGSGGPDPLTDSDIARLAYAMADAMLHAREVK